MESTLIRTFKRWIIIAVRMQQCGTWMQHTIGKKMIFLKVETISVQLEL